MLCNRLGYCISCLPGYTGRYCERDSSGRTFPSGVGVGLSVCGIVVIFIVLLVAVIKRGRSTKGNNTLKKGTKPDTYDGVNNELEDRLSHKES
nr:delta-like protein A [Biomphalaria glabrata]